MKNLYIIFVLCGVLFTAANGQTKFIESSIVSGFTAPAGLDAGDIDQDGDLDLVAASSQHGLFLIENIDPEQGSWVAKPIDTGLGASLTATLGDVDGDGYLDLLAGGWTSAQVLWYRYIPASGLWEKKVVATSFEQPHEVKAKDINGDGFTDIIAAGAGNQQITIWFNADGTGNSWEMQVVDDNFNGARSVEAADMDQDGDVDLVGASLNGNEITVWENQGGSPIVWVEHTLSTTFLGSHKVQIIDMNGDHLLDIVGTAYGSQTIAWWKNTGEIGVDWERFNVDTELQAAVIGLAHDFDGDGDMDIVGTGQDGNLITYYERTDNGENSWSKKILRDDFGGPWPICLGDFNNDHHTDFVVGGNAENELLLFQNEQSGRINTQLTIQNSAVPFGLFVPEEVEENMPLFLVLPYCGDGYGYSRVRDMLIPIVETTNAVIAVVGLEDDRLSDSENWTEGLMNEIIESIYLRYPIYADSVYLVGMECGGQPIVDAFNDLPSSVRGLIPFNPLVGSFSPEAYADFPDLPLCLCSGTNHPDRDRHVALVNVVQSINRKAIVMDLQGVGSEVLVGNLVEKILDCRTFIDTVSGTSTGRSEIVIGSTMDVFPNPSNGSFTIRWSSIDSPKAIYLTNGLGQVVWKKVPSNSANSLSISAGEFGLVSGLYFLQAEVKGALLTRKVLIN